MTCSVSSRRPPAADREDLANEAGSRIAAEVRCERGILFGADQPAKRHFSLEPLLESRVGLNFRSVVRGVRDEVLSDGVHLDPMLRQLQRNRLHIRQLCAARGAVTACSLLTPKRCGATHQEDPAASTLEHLRQYRRDESRHRVDQMREDHAPLGIADFCCRCARRGQSRRRPPLIAGS